MGNLPWIVVPELRATLTEATPACVARTRQVTVLVGFWAPGGAGGTVFLAAPTICRPGGTFSVAVVPGGGLAICSARVNGLPVTAFLTRSFGCPPEGGFGGAVTGL